MRRGMETTGDRRLARPLSVAVWALLGFVLLYVSCVATEPGQHLDEAARQWLSVNIGAQGWAEPALGWVSAGSLVGLSAVVAVTTALARGRAVAAIGVCATLLIVLTSEILKLVLERPEFQGYALANSFPSGHVAVVAGLATALLIGVPARYRRLVVLVSVGPVVFLTGLATVVLQWHRPSDVLGSVLVSVVIGTVAMMLADHPDRRRTLARTDVEAPSPSLVG